MKKLLSVLSLCLAWSAFGQVVVTNVPTINPAYLPTSTPSTTNLVKASTPTLGNGLPTSPINISGTSSYATSAGIAGGLSNAVVTMPQLAQDATEWAQRWNYQSAEPIAPIVWDDYGTWILNANETNIATMATFAANNNLRAAGVTTIHLNEGWSGTNRSPTGQIWGNTNLFPSGITKTFSNIISAGMNVGLFISMGNQSQNGYIGEGGNFFSDLPYLVTNYNARFFQCGDFLNTYGAPTNASQFWAAARDIDTAIQNTGQRVWTIYSGSGNLTPTNINADGFNYYQNTFGNGWLYWDPHWMDLYASANNYSNMMRYAHFNLAHPVITARGHGPAFTAIDCDLGNGAPSLYLDFTIAALLGGFDYLRWSPYTNFDTQIDISFGKKTIFNPIWHDVREDNGFLMAEILTNYTVNIVGHLFTNEIWLKPMTGQKCAFGFFNAATNAQPFTISYNQLKTMGNMPPIVTVLDAFNGWPMTTLSANQNFTVTNITGQSAWLFEAVPPSANLPNCDTNPVYASPHMGDNGNTIANMTADGLRDGLILQLPFSENGGAVTRDRSPYHVVCRLTSTNTWSSAGHFGSCFAGDGTNYIDIPHYPASYNLTNLSANLWFKFPAGFVITNRITPFCVGDLGNTPGDWFFVLATNNSPWLNMNTPSAGSVYLTGTTANLCDGKWHMWTLTWNGATLNDYMDTVLVNSASVAGSLPEAIVAYYPIQNQFSPLLTCVGAGNGTTYYWNGLIDELSVWNRTLNAYEITNLFTNPR